MSSNSNHKLIVAVKQGEEINLGFTIKQNNNPYAFVDTSILFQVKKAPYEDCEPIIKKEITTTSDINTVGNINFPELGQFIVHLTKEDTSNKIGEYYLVISLIGNNMDNIISSNNCQTAIFKICEQ